MHNRLLTLTDVLVRESIFECVVDVQILKLDTGVDGNAGLGMCLKKVDTWIV